MSKNFKLNLQIWLQIWIEKDKAKYFEMIFGVLKLKFDEDKAYSLRSENFAKSRKSARETSRLKKNQGEVFLL